MSPADIDERVAAPPAPPEPAPDPPRPRPRRRRRWWASGDWWLRTTAAAALGKLVGALLTGAGLLLAWLAAKAAGWIS